MMDGHALKLSNAFGFLREFEVLGMQVAVRDVVQAIAPGSPVIVNIGAGAGTSGLAIVEAGANPHFVYTIDVSPGGPHGGMENERVAFRDAGMPDRVPVQILSDSVVAGKAWDETVQIDLLFIDGDHSESGLRGDLSAWLRHVRHGGWVLFHDYQSVFWGDVVKVVDEIMPQIGHLAFTVETLQAWRVG